MLKYFVSLQNRLADLRSEEGQTMAEYGVVLAVITVGIVLALGALATGINGALGSALDAITPG
jgi:Flp pilus assembly pilin Flp